MNNSDLSELTEEKLAAYFDGKLSARECAELERTNPGLRAELETEWPLSASLRAGSGAPILPHGDFFNHGILREIEREQAAAVVPERARPFSIWRLVLAGSFCLLVALGVFQGFVHTDAREPRYFAQVLSVRAGDPQITAEAVDGDGLAVLWIDGLDFLPSDYVLE